MSRAFLLQVLAFLALGVVLDASYDVTNFELVENVKIETVVKGVYDDILVSFGVGEKRFSAQMTKNRRLFDENYKLTLQNSQDGVISETPMTNDKLMAYVGLGDNATRHRFVIVNADYNNPSFMGSVELEKDKMVLLDPAVRHQEGVIHRRGAEDVSGSIAFSPSSANLESMFGERINQYVSVDEGVDEKRRRAFEWETADLSSISPSYLGAADPKPSNCPNTRATFNIGFVVDNLAFSSAFSSSSSQAQAEIAALVQFISSRYEADVNMRLTLDNIVVLTQPGTEGWGPGVGGFNNPTCSDILPTLYSFGYYRGVTRADLDTSSDLVELITTCYPYGTVGIAWTDAVGLTTAFQNGGAHGLWVSGVGVNSYVGDFWTVIAHEIGHGFGAGHDHGTASNKGIMSYHDHSWEFSKFSQTEMCNKYASQHSNFATLEFETSVTCECPNDSCGYYTCEEGITVTCGGCGSGEVCGEGNVCVDECFGPCVEGQCGSNACGKQCGSCGEGQVCSASNVCESIVEEGTLAQVALEIVNQERARFELPTLKWSAEMMSELNTVVACDNYKHVPITHYNSFGSAKVGAGENYADYIRYLVEKGGMYYQCDEDRFGFSVGGAYSLDWKDPRYFREQTTVVTERYRTLLENGPPVDDSLLLACANVVCDGSTNPDEGMDDPWVHVFCAMGPLFKNNAGGTSQPKPSCPTSDCTTASTCQDAFVGCGKYVDSCGELQHCGECEFGVCVDGACSCLPATCESLGFPKGRVSDGCGGVLTCSEISNEACENPPSREEVCVDDYGNQAECGIVRYAEGCPPISCGTCNGEYDCSRGVCVECNEVCSVFGFCVPSVLPEGLGFCECEEGYEGDGTVCVKSSTKRQCGLGAWEEFGIARSITNFIPEGDNCGVRMFSDGPTEYCSLPDCGYHLVSKQYNRVMEMGDVVQFRVEMNERTKSWGMFLGGKHFYPLERSYAEMILHAEVVSYDSSKGWTIRLGWTNVRVESGEKQRSGTYGKITVPKVTTSSSSSSVPIYVEAEVLGPSTKKAITQVQFRVSVDGTTHSLSAEFPINLGRGLSGSVGLVTEGECLFEGFQVISHRTMTFGLFGCPTAEEIRERMMALLGLLPEEISNVSVTCDDNGNGDGGAVTRQAAVAGATSTVSMTIVGNGVPASALATQVNGALTSGLAPGIQSASTPLGPGGAVSAPVTTTGVTGATGGGGGGSAGLSGGAIAGIVVGTTAAVVLLFAGAVVATSDGDSDVESDPERPKSFAQRARAGIPVMRPDSAKRRMRENKHNTITGRGPNRV